MAPLNWMAPEEFRAKLAKSVRPVNAAIRKAAVPEVEVVNDEARTIKFILSDERVDRDKDTVSSKGWDLENYKKNPVVLWAHDYEQLPIGRAISVGVEGGQLKAVAEFMPAELNPLADTVYRMLKGGWLKGNSVGFKPKDFDYNAERKGVDFRAQELMEFSVVPVPSHPGALAEAKAAGVDLAPVQKWAVDTLVAVQKSNPTHYGNTEGPSHSRGTGDPLRDVEGCSNGQLCPKMQDQPCVLAEGCPMGKGATGILPKRGRMISAANESKLRYATSQINSILDKLNPAEQAEVINDVVDPQPEAPQKAWPPGQPGAPQTGTGFADQPPKPQPGTEPDAEKPSDKVTAAGTIVEFLATLASQVAVMLEKLSPTHLGGGDEEDEEDGDGKKPARPFPGAKGVIDDLVIKTLAERDGKFLVLAGDGKVLGTHDTRAEALAQLGAVEANKDKAVTKSTADAVEEFLLEIEDEIAAETIDLGDLTPEDLAEVIKTVARAQTHTQDRIRRGRVD